MIHSATTGFVRGLLLTLSTSFAMLTTLPASAQPANRPLLTNQAGARPNLMVSVDNSGSMAFTYHESYNITDDTEYQKKLCPTPYSNRNSTNSTTFNSGIGGESIYSAGPPETYTCYQRQRISGTWYSIARTDVAIPYTPDQAVRNWSAQRSSDVNPLYYNPRVRYLPRVDSMGNPMPANDGGALWVSNQNSTSFRYTVYQRNNAPFDYQIYHSTYANDGTTRNYQLVGGQRLVNTLNPSGFTSLYNLNYTTLRIPQHITYTNPTTASPAFTYSFCSSVVSDASSQQTGCSASTKVDVRYGDTATYAIPTPNTRSDCLGSVCTNAQEVANIMNWFRWYVTRQMATSTAIGLALADVNVNTAAAGAPMVVGDKFDDKLRIGYMPINDTTIPGGGNTNLAIQNTPGSPASVVTVSRGVRKLLRGSTDNTDLFNWLYSLISRGGTPLHNVIEQAANYYRRLNGVTEYPWRSLPTNASSPEMQCRRSFNLLFSDGGWSSTPYAPAAGPDYDNINGLNTFTRTLPDGTTESFRYMKAGINTPAGRIQYVPFASTGTGGLADITAHYYWHLDMNTGLANGIQTRPGQPTFWQNMATYTVGYLIKPTGEVTGTPGDLTFTQIETYKTQYTRNGPGGSTVFPSVPTGDLTQSAVLVQKRVDDFIEAGYSGGARSFSAKTAEDVKSIFNVILAEILSASGRDAGVSVSSSDNNTNDLSNLLKYSVSYQTLDNSGDIEAKELNAAGNETGTVVWSAADLLSAMSASSRRIFTMNGLNTPVDFLGSFSGLPSDVQTALSSGPNPGRIPSGTGFIDYLRGDNNALDANGLLFRQRVSSIAAMVNPPAVFMGGSRDYAYDQDGSGGVDGRGSYQDFTSRKRGYPPSLFVATNAGVMHALSAEHGTELAGIMPRRSLKHMLQFAAEPYSFEYVLDGPISQNDVFDRAKADSEGLTPTTEWKAWRQLAIGTGGRGEQTVYAVNSPIKPGAAPASGATDYRRQPDKADFLWETGPDIIDTADGGDVETGYMSNPARSGQTEDLSDETNAQRGRWIVAVNNGHYNGEGGNKAGLVVLDAITGAVVRTVPLPSGYSAGRGLSGVTLLRSYGTNTRVVAAYAGDANGHLWKFNLSGAPSTWHVEHDQPLFTVPGNRPIYGHPAWQGHKYGDSSDGFIVVFATGIALEEGDLDDHGDQTIYGIWDRQLLDGTMLNGETFSPVTQSQLEERVVEHASEQSMANGSAYAITGDSIDWNTQRGWFIRMTHAHETDSTQKWGERSIADVQNFGPNVIITSTVLQRPATDTLSDGETCNTSELPVNYVYGVRARDASPALSVSVDVNGNGAYDAGDFWTSGSGASSAYAVFYAPAGGFSRGTSLVTWRATAAGVPLTEEAATTAGGSSDPQIVEPTSTRIKDSADEPSGESILSSNGGVRCQTLGGKLEGTAATAIGMGVYCPTSGWSRTQFQLSGPPEH